MTSFLHTADLHLSGNRPERWDALDALVEEARERDVDALLIAGDLLDAEEDAAALRPRVRERLDALSVPVLLLPGNHDRTAFAPGQDWGGTVHLLVQTPAGRAAVEGVRVIGVPFPEERTSFGRLRRHVRERVEPDRPNVLVAHGTLIDPSDSTIQERSQDDEPGRYFPIRPRDLEGLGLDYVALGHYHQHALLRLGSTTVAYSGSPTPVGSHAWGPRTAALVHVGRDEAEGARVETLRLPVGYRRREERWLTPFEEGSDLEELEERLTELADPLCSMEVRLEGVLAGLTETELRERTSRLREGLEPDYEKLEFELRGVGLDPRRADLFGDFRRRLEARAREAEEEGEPLEPEVRRRTLQLAARALTR